MRCADLDLVLDRMDHEHGPELGPRTMRCSGVLSHALRGACSGGAPSELILVDYMETLDTLAAASNWGEVRGVMHRALDGLLGQVRTNYGSDVAELVGVIRVTMRQDPGAVRCRWPIMPTSGGGGEVLARVSGNTLTIIGRSEGDVEVTVPASSESETADVTVQVTVTDPVLLPPGDRTLLLAASADEASINLLDGTSGVRAEQGSGGYHESVHLIA